MNSTLRTPPPDFIPNDSEQPCSGCANSEKLGFRFNYAYQPIVDLDTRTIYAHEALIRGPDGEPANTVLSRVNETNRYRFDQACRVKAIKTAAQLEMQSMLSINFIPNAIYRPEVCIRATLEAARTHGFPIERIIFETVEGERIDDGKWLAEVLREYKRIGFLTAIDDFGAGFAGLNLLADFQPDIVKLDMGLVRDIDQRTARQAITRGVVRICEELKISIIAEGVETADEAACLHAMGVSLMQGYLFSRPLFQTCGNAETMNWPAGVKARAPVLAQVQVSPRQAYGRR
ncbi:MAG: EAL domain-containing protein [Proteobacteria bacterium]|nr:EAL domain-containing protein [Burkholderiales bacterium]